MSELKYSIIYARVSDPSQVKYGHSIREQVPMLTRFAKENGYIVKQSFVEEAKSATTTVGRDELYKALLYIENNQDVSALIVQDTDRLARSERDYFGIRAFLQEHNVQLLSKNQPGINDSPEGRFMDAIMASVHAFQSRYTGKKVSDIFNELARKGITTRKAPLGYTNIQTDNGDRLVKTVEFDPDTAMRIKNAFELYSTGNYSTTEIADILNRENVVSPRGNMIHHSIVTGMLSNPYYTGKIRHKGVIYDGRHPALVSESVFQKCKDILAEHNQYAIRRRKPENHKRFFLRGFLKCGICGHGVVGASVGKRHCLYYYCGVNKTQKGYHQNKGQSFPIGDAEEQVLGFFKLLCIKPSITDEVLERAREILKETHSDVDNECTRLLQKKTKLEKQRRVLEEKLLDNVISDGTYTFQHIRIEEEITRITTTTEQASSKRTDNTTIFETLVRLARNLPMAYGKSTPEIKKLYLGIFWDRFEIKDKEIVKAVPSKIVCAMINDGMIELRANTPAQKVLLTKVWCPRQESNL